MSMIFSNAVFAATNSEGLDQDGFSSSPDLMKTVRVLCFGEEAFEGPTGHPDEILPSEGSEDVETSPRSGASQALGVEDF